MGGAPTVGPHFQGGYSQPCCVLYEPRRESPTVERLTVSPELEPLGTLLVGNGWRGWWDCSRRPASFSRAIAGQSKATRLSLLDSIRLRTYPKRALTLSSEDKYASKSTRLQRVRALFG